LKVLKNSERFSEILKVMKNFKRFGQMKYSGVKFQNNHYTAVGLSVVTWLWF
jgi:glutaredoxin-related protein